MSDKKFLYLQCTYEGNLRVDQRTKSKVRFCRPKRFKGFMALAKQLKSATN